MINIWFRVEVGNEHIPTHIRFIVPLLVTIYFRYIDIDIRYKYMINIWFIVEVGNGHIPTHAHALRSVQLDLIWPMPTHTPRYSLHCYCSIYWYRSWHRFHFDLYLLNWVINRRQPPKTRDSFSLKASHTLVLAARIFLKKTVAGFHVVPSIVAPISFRSLFIKLGNKSTTATQNRRQFFTKSLTHARSSALGQL